MSAKTILWLKAAAIRAVKTMAQAAVAMLPAAAEYIREQRKKNANTRVITYCLALLLIVAMICATVFAN